MAKRSTRTAVAKPAVSTALAKMPPVIVIPAPDLEIVECGMRLARFSDNSGLFCYLAGSVRNNSRYTFDSVRIEFNVYAADGSLLGNVSDYVSNLEPGVTWRFRARYYGGVAAKWKPTELNGTRPDSWQRINYLAGPPREAR